MLTNPLGMSNRGGAMLLGAVAAVLVALLVGGWWGWTRGSASAENKLRAEYSANLAEATREAVLKQQAAIVFSNGLAVELIDTKRTIETQRSRLRGRIVYVTREIPADCVLPADAVQLWNQARRLSAPGVPQAGGPGRAAGQAAAAAPAGAGQGNATIADAMADHIDYVAWCEGVVSQRDKLQTLLKEWAK
ncbi:MAG: hypothetical protein RDU24_08860 [Humidesulfovibrio sp.]|uniref:hypothetical protein n=1 Tax=Humidesulfovibrio sp. TaxID=2910988 RepID=UPI0027FB2C96|nr:hypothetical protein [Humidesulfovibrio sp.]MDQ7835478.1 hypothetical protein [Humidesulfovibrio sp.]